MLKGQKSKSAVKKSTKKSVKKSTHKKDATIQVSELEALVNAVKGSSVEEIVVSKGESFVKILRDPQVVAKEEPPSKPSQKNTKEQIKKQAKEEPKKSEKKEEPEDAKSLEGTHDILSPDVGIFLRAKDEKSDPYAKLRDVVKRGQVVAMLKYMGINHEVRSEDEGKIVEILVEDGQAVVYGQPLFRLK